MENMEELVLRLVKAIERQTEQLDTIITQNTECKKRHEVEYTKNQEVWELDRKNFEMIIEMNTINLARLKKEEEKMTRWEAEDKAREEAKKLLDKK